jgi:hypothetical protein
MNSQPNTGSFSADFMSKLVQLGVPLLHGMVGSRLWNLAVTVILSMMTRSMETLLVATFAITLVQKADAREDN